MSDVAGKVAIVTGAAGAIGSATVRVMVEQGARVVMADIQPDGLEALRGELGDVVIARVVDVTDADQVASLVDTAVSEFGRLDILHNNAAAGFDDDTDGVRTTTAAWQKSFELVLMSCVFGCRAAIPVMVEQGGGRIVNTSSGSAQAATGSRITYGTMKGAVESFTRHIATMHGHEGIRCNAVAPGFVMTPGTAALFTEEQRQMFEQSSAVGRLATPRDIGEVVAFLASDGADYVNGQSIAVNGNGQRMVAW